MSLVLATQADIVTGIPFQIPAMTLIINGVGIDSGTVVKAAIVSRDLSTTFTSVLTCTYTAPVAPATVGTWSAVFSESETRKLLIDPLNLASKLQPLITRSLDVSGLGTVLVEIQIGAPYWQTRQAVATVSKGLID